MTIPMAVMVISLLTWFVLAMRKYKYDVSWLIDVSRIAFAASLLVVLWNVMNRSLP